MKQRHKRFSILQFTKEIGKRLYEHDILTYSASLSYYTLLSFIPLIFISIAGIGEMMGRRFEVTGQSVAWVKSLFPFITIGIEKNIYGIVEKRGLFGGIGLFTLIWSAHMVLAEGELVIRKVFGVHKKRWILLSHIIAWGIFLLSVIFCAVSFILGLYLRLVADDVLPSSLLKTLNPFINLFLMKYVPAIMVMITVTAAYKFLPQRKVPLPTAFIGGISFAAFWELAKKLFFVYAAKAHYLSIIYGSLTTLMLFLFFVYYSALLFIVIAEFLACSLDMKE